MRLSGCRQGDATLTDGPRYDLFGDPEPEPQQSLLLGKHERDWLADNPGHSVEIRQDSGFNVPVIVDRNGTAALPYGDAPTVLPKKEAKETVTSDWAAEFRAKETWTKEDRDVALGVMIRRAEQAWEVALLVAATL